MWHIRLFLFFLYSYYSQGNPAYSNHLMQDYSYRFILYNVFLSLSLCIWSVNDFWFCVLYFFFITCKDDSISCINTGHFGNIYVAAFVYWKKYLCAPSFTLILNLQCIYRVLHNVKTIEYLYCYFFTLHQTSRERLDESAPETSVILIFMGGPSNRNMHILGA